MKMRVVSSQYVLTFWKMSIETMFFPDALFEELRPDRQIEAWGDGIISMRESLRSDVDLFVERLFEYDTHEAFWETLRKTDPRVVALYYDRLNASSFSLQSLVSDKEYVEIPDSWMTLTAQILFQKLPQ